MSNNLGTLVIAGQGDFLANRLVDRCKDGGVRVIKIRKSLDQIKSGWDGDFFMLEEPVYSPNSISTIENIVEEQDLERLFLFPTPNTEAIRKVHIDAYFQTYLKFVETMLDNSRLHVEYIIGIDGFPPSKEIMNDAALHLKVFHRMQEKNKGTFRLLPPFHPMKFPKLKEKMGSLIRKELRKENKAQTEENMAEAHESILLDLAENAQINMERNADFWQTHGVSIPDTFNLRGPYEIIDQLLAPRSEESKQGFHISVIN